jgi:tellurite methyltransferase
MHLAVPGTSQRSKTTWSPWAREYARTPERYVFGTAPSDFALEVARLIRPGDYVLDLGCGEGRDSVFFAGLGASVTGVDVSAEGLAKARRLARARGVRVSWWRGFITGALPPGPFDLIYSCGSIHYVPRADRGALFARLKTATRPDGHQAHLVFTNDLVHEEKGEVVEYFTAGELHEAFVDWQTIRSGQHVISCAQDGTVHGHAVDELVTAWRPGPAPQRFEP